MTEREQTKRLLQKTVVLLAFGVSCGLMLTHLIGSEQCHPGDKGCQNKWLIGGGLLGTFVAPLYCLLRPVLEQAIEACCLCSPCQTIGRCLSWSNPQDLETGHALLADDNDVFYNI